MLILILMVILNILRKIDQKNQIDNRLESIKNKKWHKNQFHRNFKMKFMYCDFD